MKTAITALFVAIAAGGCATSYRVQVDSYAVPGANIPANAQIAVKAEPNVPNPLFHNQVETKIRKLLIEQGYRPVIDGNARYELSFIFDSRTRTELDYYYDYAPYAYAGYYNYPYWYGHGYYSPYSRTVQDYWLVIRIFDRQMAKDPGSFIWVGEAGTSRSYSGKRDAVDYLLVALFKYFMQDTEKDITITIKKTDLQLYDLAPAEY